MPIRAYTADDEAALRAIHAAQKFPYAFPDLSNPLFLTKLVLTRDPAIPSGLKPCATSEILGAALLRLTAEAYLLLDPGKGTPRERWNAVLALQSAAQQDAAARGLEDVHAWLPPPVAERFGRRLAQLGWQRDDAWTPYCRRFAG
ncbi:MAG TPA: hypothetical protein VMT51_15320 [Dongiaceae bacterium]|nr:hypothetical protein [Dongiaceae bacterium]